MHDFKIKAIAVVLSAVVFSMLFIILALVLPVNDGPKTYATPKPKGMLEKVSHSLKD